MPRFFGGVETYTLKLARSLQNLGHQVHILAGEPTARKDLVVELRPDVYEGLPVTRLIYDYTRYPVSNRASYSAPPVTTQIKTALQKLQPDIVHATSLSLLMGGIIEAASSLNLPLIYTATDFVLTCRRGTYLKRDNHICSDKENLELCTACMGPHTRLEKLLNRACQLAPHQLAHPVLPLVEKVIGKKADFVHARTSIKQRLDYLPGWRQKIECIIAPSTYMRDMFILNDYPADKIIVSPYGVDPPPVNFEKIPSPKLRFGFIGRITFIKGVHLLLEAFGQLAPPEQVELTLYGGADVKKAESYEQMLHRRAAPLANVNFVGLVDNAAISQIYRQLDFLVAPSIWPENSPITILEAQAHGIPVIASDVGGIRDLIRHRVNGLIFSSQNVQDLAAQMAQGVASPELVAELAANSRLVQSIQQDANAINKLYNELIG